MIRQIPGKSGVMKSYLDDETRKKDMGTSSYTPLSEQPEDVGGPPPEYAVPERTSVIEQLRLAIVQPKKLIGLSMLSVGRFIRYGIFLALLVTVMTYVVPTAATIASFGGFKKLFSERMPGFYVKNGELTAERTFSLSLGDYEILIDSEENAVSPDKYLGKMVTIAIGKKQIQVAVSQNGISTVITNQKVSDYLEDGFSRDTLIDAIPGFYIGLGIMGILSLLGVLVRYMVASLLYMILAWSFASQTSLDLNKGNVFRLCFYAQTIGILLVNLNTAMGRLLPSMLISIVGIFISIRWILKTYTPYLRFNQQMPGMQ